jgi:hypothetical protein
MTRYKITPNQALDRLGQRQPASLRLRTMAGEVVDAGDVPPESA